MARIFWARRIAAGLFRSGDGDGGATFQRFGDGLLQSHAYHPVYRQALDVHKDGAARAMASTTGGMWVSSDSAERW